MKSASPRFQRSDRGTPLLRSPRPDVRLQIVQPSISATAEGLVRTEYVVHLRLHAVSFVNNDQIAAARNKFSKANVFRIDRHCRSCEDEALRSGHPYVCIRQIELSLMVRTGGVKSADARARLFADIFG